MVSKLLVYKKHGSFFSLCSVLLKYFLNISLYEITDSRFKHASMYMPNAWHDAGNLAHIYGVDHMQISISLL